jgi:uncharacterized heparinase superfamily protein
MLQKIKLYLNTVRYMKPEQIYYRIKKIAKAEIKLKTSVASSYKKIYPVATLLELDFDTVFLQRFPVNELMQGKISFLHNTESFDWNEEWNVQGQSALWNFNLHYFEFLHSLTKAYLDTQKEEYLEESKKAILGWIKKNPVNNGGNGWASYTIALRLTNWLSYWTNLQEMLKIDEAFSKIMLNSIYEQYAYLSKHLEKDLLGNHYFEDLKALILCSLFFGDKDYEKTVLSEFKKECKEQILKDGMHFELSPMYHKIIFEDVLRVAWALQCADRPDREIEAYIKPMADVAYTFEHGLSRIPLFNDGGNNVAKSLTALMEAVEKYFGITPEEKEMLPESGYYFFSNNNWKLIVDAGQPGPTYIPGHAHCDAMSFELFKNGEPVLVNCGTYAYQCKERSYFRSTRAHNTVMINNTEQSQCWGAFRLAKRSKLRILSVKHNSIEMELTDQKGQKVIRKIKLDNKSLSVKDTSPGNHVTEFFHFAWLITGEKVEFIKSGKENIICDNEQLYSTEYGVKQKITEWQFSAADGMELCIDLEGVYASGI